MRVGGRPEEGPEAQGCPGVYNLEGRARPGAVEQAAPSKAGSGGVWGRRLRTGPEIPEPTGMCV